MNLQVHHLRFDLRAETLIHLGPQAGAQLRGALWAALRQFACSAPTVQGDPDHARHCPMCRLMALETQDNARGGTPPRPFAIRPPLTSPPGHDQLFERGMSFQVGVNLFGDAAALFPYICQAFARMGASGIGYGRGLFSVIGITAHNPLTGETASLLDGTRVVAGASLPVRAAHVQAAAHHLPADRLKLRLLTPTEITRQGGKVADRPDFAALIARLVERCQALELHYTDAPTARTIWQARYQELTQTARAVRVVADQTRWVRVSSGSRRTDSVNAISGLAGEFVVEGDLAPLREWLVWGSSVHVGKNVVKGNGWYQLALE